MWARGRWVGRFLLRLAAARAPKAPCRWLGPGSAGCGLQSEVAAGRALGGGEEKVVCGAPGQTLSNFNIDFVATLLRQENAKDICVIQVPPEFKYSDYFIIVSGTSTRHVQAMAQYLLKMVYKWTCCSRIGLFHSTFRYKHLKQDDDPYVQIEGKDTEDWMCIDFGSMVIHLMLPETREVYELEKLWTLRSYDDQLAQIVPESLPDDFIFGLESQQE